MAEDSPNTDPMAGVAESIRELATTIATENAAFREEVRGMVQTLTPPPPVEPVRNAALIGKGVDPSDRQSTRFEAAGWTRADFELAGMFVEGAKRMSRPVEITMPEDFDRERKVKLFEQGSKIMVADADGNPVRAMDSQETGFGLQLIGAQYESDMWRAARNSDPLIGMIRNIPMAAPVTYVPIDGVLPEMLFLAESTSASATAYTTTKTATNVRTLTAKKFGINQIWSGELDQDSIVAFTPFLRDMLFRSAAHFLASS